jgi:uncharacterized iron-regulated membrane protein
MNRYGRALMGLHAWGGMVFGWLLVPIFIAGSLAVFEPEISHWMRPELSAPDFSQARAVALGDARLREVGAGAAVWRLRLPTAREPTLGIGWGSDPRRMTEQVLDAATGEALVPRRTEGGHFFTDLHAELQLGAPGRWLVGAVGIFLLAALLSGVLMHHRILQDFFTLHPHAGSRRAWLDAHNLIAVATLPFLLMVAYTGVVILAETFMPAATRALYDSRPGYPRADVVRAFDRPPRGEHAVPQPLTEAFAQAEAVLGEGTVSNILVRRPWDGAGVVQVYRHVDDRLAAVADHVAFDAVTGERIGLQQDWNGAARMYRAQVGLHVAHFGGPAIRGLYFVSGLLGAATMAAGIVLFLRKLRARSGNSRRQRVLEALGVASVCGPLLGCAAYFWSNRLLAPTVDGREVIEMAVFFAVWALAVPHGWLRGAAAWRDQLVLAATLAFGLPLLDLTGGVTPDALRVGVNSVACTMGAAALLTGLRLFGRAR